MAEIPIDLQEIHQRLGLPPIEPIDPTTTDVQSMPPVRRWRVDTSKMPDQQLIYWFNEAQIYALPSVILKAGPEILNRESLREKVDPESVWSAMANHASNLTERREYLIQAAAAARQKGKSPAKWLLEQLPVQLGLRDGEGFNQTLNTLHAHHWGEPGVAETVVRLLQHFGLMTGEGQPVEPPGEAEPQAPEPGKLWTPDQGSPGEGAGTDESTPRQSKLWIPGSD
jgi:hypothetical protein